jgi:hypothetical protein
MRRSKSSKAPAAAADRDPRTDVSLAGNNPDAAKQPQPQADVEFFKAFPHRSYRVRLATPAEIDALHQRGEAPPPLGYWWFTFVKQIAPGHRHKHFSRATPLPFELDETLARISYYNAASRGAIAHALYKAVSS